MKSLLFLTFLFVAMSVMAAQPAARSSATATRFLSRKGLVKKTKKSSLRVGPKVKNPRATGRAGKSKVMTVSPSRQQLKGPKYKNLKRPGKRKTEAASASRKQLYGPRYKNRYARKVRHREGS